MLQQPTGATGLGVLGQSAHRQFGLLPVRASDVGIGHSVYGSERVQHSPRGLQPARPLQHTELVFNKFPAITPSTTRPDSKKPTQGEVWLRRARIWPREAVSLATETGAV